MSSTTASEAVNIEVRQEAPKRASSGGGMGVVACVVAVLALGMSIGALATAIAAWDEVHNHVPEHSPFVSSYTISKPAPNLEWYSYVPMGVPTDSPDPPTVPIQAGKQVVGFLEVPLDHDDPDNSPKTKVRIQARLARVLPAKHTMIVHCGGPGSGADCVDSYSPVQFIPDKDARAMYSGFALSERFLDEYNIIGIDQRGIGRSVGPKGVPFKASGAVHGDASWNVIYDGHAYVLGGKLQAGVHNYSGTPPYSLKDFVNLTANPCVYDRFDFIYSNPRDISTPDGEADFYAAYESMSDAMARCYHSHLWQFDTGHNYLDYVGTTNLAFDLAALLDAIGVEKATVHGTSYGTVVTSVFATLFPERVEKAVTDGNAGATMFGADDFTHLNSEAVVNALAHYDELVRATNLATRTNPVGELKRLIAAADAGHFKYHTPSLDLRFPGGWVCDGICMWEGFTNAALQDNTYRYDTSLTGNNPNPSKPEWVGTEATVKRYLDAVDSNDVTALSEITRNILAKNCLTLDGFNPNQPTGDIYGEAVCIETISANVWIWAASYGTRYRPNEAVGKAKALALQYPDRLGASEALQTPGFLPFFTPGASIAHWVRPGGAIKAIQIGNLYDSQTPYRYSVNMVTKWPSGVLLTTDMMMHGATFPHSLNPAQFQGSYAIPNWMNESGITECDDLQAAFILDGVQPPSSSSCRIKYRVALHGAFDWCSPSCDYINPAKVAEADYSAIAQIPDHI